MYKQEQPRKGQLTPEEKKERRKQVAAKSRAKRKESMAAYNSWKNSNKNINK